MDHIREMIHTGQYEAAAIEIRRHCDRKSVRCMYAACDQCPWHHAVAELYQRASHG